MAAAARADDLAIAWEPQPGPQTALITCPVFEVFYGGARGGGKTDGVLGEFASHAAQYGEHAIGLMVRRTREQLVETIERSRVIYTRIGAKLVDNLWRFPNGARLRFAYLERDADAENYQGHSYTRVYVEEIGTFPSAAPILKLLATLRSGHGVPVGFRATGNPGGPGHQWVKARYIDAAPLGWKVTTHSFENPFTKEIVTRDRVYIPSRLSDNEYLGGGYVANLHMAGSPELVRAWLEGDWNVVLGAYFPEFGPRHVVAPRELPEHWTRFRAFDWGSYRPFSVGWYAVSDGELPDFPRGALIRYREWYGASEPNVGLKMTAEQVADGILARETRTEREAIASSVADPAIFAADGGPSIAERMFGRGITFRRADNARVSRGGAMGGWDQVRSRLVGEDGRPMVYFFSTNVHLIRTLPALQHDELKPEDVDTEGEDHAADELRYACMSRPYTAPKPKAKEPMRGIHEMTMNELWAMQKKPAKGRIA